MEVRTASGRRWVVDEQPHPGGTLVPIRRDDGTAVAYLGEQLWQVLPGSQLPALVPAWRQHAVTCVAAAAASRLSPRCRCSGLLDAALLVREPEHRTHPCCDPVEGPALAYWRRVLAMERGRAQSRRPA
jgi:hypothetical protein